MISLFALVLVGLCQPPADPPADPNVRVMVGIEIGSIGVKALVISVRFVKGKELPEITKLYAKTNNTVVLTADKKLTPAAIMETAAAVQSFYEDIRKRYPGVRDKDMFVVSSSSVSMAAEWHLLEKEVLKQTKFKLEPLDQTREFMLGLHEIVPLDEIDDAVMLDIGGGNVKCGYYESGTPGPKGPVERYTVIPKEELVIPGTTLFAGILAGKTPTGPYDPATAAAYRKTQIADPIARAIDRKAGLINRPKWFITGGAVWMFTSVMFPEQVNSRFVTFTADDIRDYLVLVKKGDREFPDAQMGRIADLTPPLRAQTAKDAAAQYKSVKNTFNPMKAAAAGEILLGFVEGCNITPKSKKTMTFVRDGTFGWLLALVKKGLVAEEAPADPMP